MHNTPFRSLAVLFWVWVASSADILTAGEVDSNRDPRDFVNATSMVDWRRRLAGDTSTMNKEEEQALLAQTHAEHLALFTVSESIATLGPTIFPKPTHVFDQHEDEIVTYIQPVHGTHRRDRDAVFLFAAEYSLHNYMIFLTTLRDTGYDGDVVMAISTMDWAKTDVQEYLQHDPLVVVYVVEYECYNAEGDAVESAKGGIRVCKQDHLFGRRTKGGTVEPLPDPRHARTVQNSRYELYWIWAELYHAHSWILLIDARDTIFQRNPFELVPRQSPTDHAEGGILMFFGENVDATRLGQSAHNRDWLTKAYGKDVAVALANKPTICSGSTIGEQVAIEMYLRAMVMESDETQTVKMGADQGFHNRLYYSNKLSNVIAIQQIIIQDQGFGIINNLGALRTKPLDQWGNGKLLDVDRLAGDETKDLSSVQHIHVRNWDGSLSPVVHQFDRHKELSNWYFKTKKREFQQRWNELRKSQVQEK